MLCRLCKRIFRLGKVKCLLVFRNFQMTDREQQRDELTVMESIYPEMLHYDGENEWVFTLYSGWKRLPRFIDFGNRDVTLKVN